MSNTYEVGEHDTRPWGTWEVIAVGASYVVKRIMVKPGQRLSLQRHQHRAEHWTMVEGSGEVTLDENVLPCTVGEHFYLPIGTVHRIHNTGSVPLTYIEVQQGEVLDENDIERLQDDYGRIPA